MEDSQLGKPHLLDLDAPEFQDQEDSVLDLGGQIDWSRLVSVPVLYGFLAVGLGLVLLQGRSEERLSAALAALFIVWAVVGLMEMVRTGGVGGVRTIPIVAALASAFALLFLPRFSIDELGFLAGGFLILWGLTTGVRVFRTHPRGSRADLLIAPGLAAAIGVSLLLSPERLLGIAVLLVSFYLLLGGLLAVVMNLRSDGRVFMLGEIWPSTLEWLQTRPHTADDRLQLYGQIFYEGPEATRRLSRFFALMAFATGIASFGIIAESTAVVIGAMLVAPLMIPLMGTALAMVMGWPRRATTSALVALGGIGLSIGLAVVFGWIYGVEISPTLNSEVASRVGPTLVDLAIAIAAGGAGGFALSRPDVSDSLPGVAVAIALVPPLAVVGLMISQNDWVQAAGAMLLFVTNLVAILLVGALVFVITGVVPVLQLRRKAQWVRKSLTMVGALAILVVGVLGLSSETYAAEIEGTNAANAEIDSWLDGTELVRITSSVDPNKVTVTVAGPETPPPVEDLAESLAQALGRVVDVEVFLVPRDVFTFNADN